MHRTSTLLAVLPLLVPSLPLLAAVESYGSEISRIPYGLPHPAPRYILAKSARPNQWMMGSSVPSRNVPRPIPSNSPYADKGVQLIALPRESELFHNEYEGFAVLFVNASSDKVFLGRCDRCPTICLEALDPEGVWQEIQFLEADWSGNGYPGVDISPGQYYRFAAPRF